MPATSSWSCIPSSNASPCGSSGGADGQANEAFYGDRWFRSERYDGDLPDEPPQEWHAYPGLYRNDDPWMPTLRVVLRKGQLALQFPVELSDEAGEAELQPLEGGWFAVGKPWQPRRIRFDRLVDGSDRPRRVQRRPLVPLVRRLSVTPR